MPATRGRAGDGPRRRCAPRTRSASSPTAVARPFTLEALRLLGDRIATHEQIDRIVPHRRRLPDGPVRAHGPGRESTSTSRSRSRSGSRASTSRAGSRTRSRRGWSPRAGSAARPGAATTTTATAPHRPDDPARRPRARTRRRLRERDDRARRLRAHHLAHGSLAARPGEDAVGYLALPTWPTRAGRTDARRRRREAARRRGGLLRRARQARRVRSATRPASSSGGSSAQLVNEAALRPRARASASAEDIDTAMRLGFNYPRGPFEWGEAIGPARVRRDPRRAARRAGRGALPGCAAASRTGRLSRRRGSPIARGSSRRPPATSRRRSGARPTSVATLIASSSSVAP